MFWTREKLLCRLCLPRFSWVIWSTVPLAREGLGALRIEVKGPPEHFGSYELVNRGFDARRSDLWSTALFTAALRHEHQLPCWVSILLSGRSAFDMTRRAFRPALSRYMFVLSS
jgi:hypothetical protein